MTGILFAAVVEAHRSGDWESVKALIRDGHLTSDEARRLVKALKP